MIKQPTVFVVGAGAHAPYQFPTGMQLRDQILKLTDLKLKTTPDEQLQTELEKFQYQFRQSGRYSIDAFLQHRKDFIEIGKRCIAILIHQSETHYARHPDRPTDWIEWMLNGPLYAGSLEEFSQNCISFVTFNYDRLLEYRLFMALRYAFNESEGETAKALEKIPIVHIHGTIGRLPWQSKAEGDYVLNFGKGDEDGYTHATRVQDGSSNIRLFHEATPSRYEDELKLARNLLAEADVINFMGFSFQEDNMKKLQLSKRAKPQQIIGTIQGVFPPDRNRIRTQISDCCNHSVLGLENDHHTCLQHLQHCHLLK